MAQSISQEAIGATGLPGATAASRHAGATTSGAPTTGTFAVGDFIVDQTGFMWVCTVAGNPGTWVKLLSGAVSLTTGVSGTLPVANGGTNLTTFTAANNALYSTSASALIAGTLPVLAGGTGVTTSTGTGSTVLGTSPVLTGAYETVSVSASALSGSTAASLAASTASFYLYTANPTASFTVNLTNVPTTTGQAVTFALGVVNGSSAYLPLNITINGTQAGASSSALPLEKATNNSITTYYQSGTAWSAADASTLNYYTITCICTGSSAWTMLLAQTKF